MMNLHFIIIQAQEQTLFIDNDGEMKGWTDRTAKVLSCKKLTQTVAPVLSNYQQEQKAKTLLTLLTVLTRYITHSVTFLHIHHTTARQTRTKNTQYKSE